MNKPISTSALPPASPPASPVIPSTDTSVLAPNISPISDISTTPPLNISPSPSTTTASPIIQLPVASALISAPSTSTPSFSSRSSIDTENGKRIEEHGFIYISVKGKPYDRGRAQGFLLADRIVKFARTYAFFLWSEYGRDITFFNKMVKDLFGPIVSEQYKEYQLEMEGIAKGVADKMLALRTQDEKDKYFTEGAVEGNKIVLPADSHLDYSNLAYNNPSDEDKQKYSSSGKVLINVDFDIIFLLNCVVSVDYVYSKLQDIFNNNKSLTSSSVYKEYSRSMQPVSASSSTGKKTKFFSLFGGSDAMQSGGAPDRCSAFMVVGSKYTSNGGITCAHITFDNFIMGQFDNVILFIDTSSSHTLQTPSYNILMQTFPGGIFSSTDFFVTSAKIMGTETTIGGFNAFELHAPACVRHRKAMQYGGTLDEYIRHLRENNSGDYANTWYIGHTVSKDSKGNQRPEIMRVELGLRYIHVEKKTEGYFIGFNACYDPRIRNLECKNDGFFDTRRHSGARRVTIDMKIKEHTEGVKRISTDDARSIISNHWDVYLEKDNPCSRTICSHYDLDKREYMSQESRPKPYQPKGSVDGKICTSDLCNNMQFLARWGNACGTDFKKEEFCDKHRQWEYQRAYLEDRLKQPWVVCSEVNIKNKSPVMSKALKEYDFASGNASNKSSIATGSVGNVSSMLPTTPVPASPLSVPASPLSVPASPLSAPALPAAASTPSIPSPDSVPLSLSITEKKQDNKIQNLNNDKNNNNNKNNIPASELSFDELVGMGGSFKPIQEFDNNKELKDFIKMFKKQNKKSYKSKNSSTRRNKKNNK